VVFTKWQRESGIKMGKEDRVAFRLKPGRDDMIIDWLNSLGDNDKSYHIREALRSYLLASGAPQPSIFHGNNVTNNNTGKSKGNDVDIQEKDNLKPVSEISEEELEKNLKGWL